MNMNVMTITGVSVLAAVIQVTTAAQTTSTPDDRAARSPAITWPAAFAPERADLFAHNEIVISAPCARLWEHLVAARLWPRWYSNARDVVIEGGRNLQQGVAFTWTTFGLPVHSRVVEFAPSSRLAWTGKTADIDAYHAWFLVESGERCRVVTEEVANGPGARKLIRSDPAAMHRGHELWLQSLKRLAER